MKTFYVYILTNRPYGTLYVGVTSNLAKRIEEHKSKEVPGFTEKYDLTRLVYAEEFPTAEEALSAEKRIKRWKRQWKIDLVEKSNPRWEELSFSM